MKILALYSNKGGVGKTAAAVNLSFLAARNGRKTLICDLDPQGSTTYYFRVKPKLKSGAKGLKKGGKAIDRSIKGTDYENLDLLPGDLSHRNLDVVFDHLKRSKWRLERVFRPLETDYDQIIIDCPPTINLLSENIFNMADMILVPLIPTTLSERTHQQLLSFFADEGYDSNKIKGFLSMVDRRKKLHQELSDKIRSEFGGVL
ncbi:MAG: AAA family ATPase, partial [Chloroflexota bacterium]